MNIEDTTTKLEEKIAQKKRELEELEAKLRSEKDRLRAHSEYATFVYRTAQGQLGGLAAVVARNREEADEKMIELAADTPGAQKRLKLEHVLDQNGVDQAILFDGNY